MGNQRIEWIDSAKGIGILLVMFSHLLYNIPPKMENFLYAGFIPLFFFLSGLLAKSDSIENTIKSKGKRLLIPLLVYSSFGLLAITICSDGSIRDNFRLWIGALYQRAGLYVDTFSAVSFLPNPIAPMWFLSALFVSYILFAVYCKLCKSSYEKLIFELFLLAYGIYIQYSYILLPWSLDTAPILCLFLILGYEIRNGIIHSDIAYPKKKWAIVLLLTTMVYFACCAELGSCNISVRDYGSSIVEYVITSALYITIICLICIIIENKVLSKALAWIGTQSLRLMCLHLIVYSIVKKIIIS